MKAAEYFNNGYSCSESMIRWAIDEGLASEDLLPAATSFSGGMGVGCLCGAIAGAQMVIGSQFGRDNIYGNENLARVKAKELAQKFMEKHKATCCRVLTRGMEFSGPNRKAHCTNMVDDCQELVKDLLNSEKSGILK
jgi:C_GCAxxG_C_C family probable redox protein